MRVPVQGSEVWTMTQICMSFARTGDVVLEWCGYAYVKLMFRFPHLKGEIATDAVSGARDEGDLSHDAAFLSREEESPGDPNVDEERSGAYSIRIG